MSKLDEINKIAGSKTLLLTMWMVDGALRAMGFSREDYPALFELAERLNPQAKGTDDE